MKEYEKIKNIDELVVGDEVRHKLGRNTFEITRLVARGKGLNCNADCEIRNPVNWEKLKHKLTN